jgi:hypothetical protein
MKADRFFAQCLCPRKARIRNCAVRILPDSTDVYKLCADGCNPSDVLRSLLDRFELGWGVLQYTHQGDDRIPILKRLGKSFSETFSPSYINRHGRQKVVLWEGPFQFGVNLVGPQWGTGGSWMRFACGAKSLLPRLLRSTWFKFFALLTAVAMFEPKI